VEIEDEEVIILKEDKIIFKESCHSSKIITNSREYQVLYIIRTISEMTEAMKETIEIINKILLEVINRIVTIEGNTQVAMKVNMETTITNDFITKETIEIFRIIGRITIITIAMTLVNIETIGNLIINRETTSKILFKLPME
jgi:hypothetical protein